MGNNNTSEAPRRPHKLPKPQVGNYQSTAGDHSVPKHGRFSTSYFVGSLLAAPAEQPSTDSTPVGISVAAPSEQVEVALPGARGGSRRDIKRLSRVIDPKPSQSDQRVRRPSIIAPGSRASDQSVIAGPGQESFPRPLTHAESIQTSGKRESVNYDMSSNEVHRFLVNQETVQELSKARSQSYTEIREVTKSTWKSSHPHHSASTPVTRTNSEASLYIPVRRRSIIQTPGVATRSQQTTQRLSSRSNSLPPTPSQSRHYSIESIAARQMPMPPAQVALEPCEAEYKQLGGMKFGSLRITNGAPELTPSPGNEDDTSCGPALTTSIASQGYFELSKSSSAIATADPDEVQNEEGLHTASSKSVLNVVNPAGGTETSCDIKSPTKAVETRLSHEQVDDARKLKLNTSPIEPASSTTLLQITSKRSASEDQLLEEDGTIPEYSAGEGLDIRDDSNAKANSERIRLELEPKTVKTLARSDSGFVSSPSSEMSRKVLSKADSGYSPNVSLRSLRSLKPLSTDKTQVSSEKPTSGVPERRISGHCEPTSAGRAKYTRRHDRSKSELPAPPPPPPKDDVPAIPGRRSSLSSLARDTINRIPTLTTSKISDSSSSRTGTMSSSELAIVNPAKPDLPTSEINGNANHTGKLQRLLGGDRAKGPPRVHEDPPIDQCIPAVPSHAQGRARKHKRRASTAPHRHAPRAKLSKETLRTILSVGSTGMLQNGETSHANDTQPQPAHGESKSGTTRKRSLYSISHSFAQATTNLLPSKKSVSRSKSATRKNVELEDTHPKTILDHEARAFGLHNVQRSMGNSTFGQAFTAITADRSSSFPMRRKTLTKMHPMERRSKKQIRSLPLKTQKSSPNVATTEAWPLSQSIAELAHVEKSKTPPPVSMHIRSIKNLRVPSPGRSRSAAPSEAPPRYRDPQFHGIAVKRASTAIDLRKTQAGRLIARYHRFWTLDFALSSQGARRAEDRRYGMLDLALNLSNR